MYADHFGLNEDPFKIAPSLRFVHRGRNFQASFRALRAGLLGRRCVMLLESAPGLGKTALLKLLVEELRRNGLDSGFEACRSWTTAEALLRKNGPTVLLLDEAHNLAERELDELLGRAAAANAKLVFAASPEFGPRIAHLEPLRRRLRPLPRREVVDYVRERLVAAGHPDGEIFAPDALVVVASASGGVPRLINRICSTSLFMAAMAQEAVVEAARIRETLATLGVDAPAALRPLQPKARPAAEVSNRAATPLPEPAPEPTRMAPPAVRDPAAIEPEPDTIVAVVAATQRLARPQSKRRPASELTLRATETAPKLSTPEPEAKPQPISRPVEGPPLPILVAERRLATDPRLAYSPHRRRRRIPGGALGVASAAAAGSMVALLTFVEAPQMLAPILPKAETVIAEVAPAEPAPAPASAQKGEASETLPEPARDTAALAPPPPPVAPTPPDDPQPPAAASKAPTGQPRATEHAAPVQEAVSVAQEPAHKAEPQPATSEKPATLARRDDPPPVQPPAPELTAEPEPAAVPKAPPADAPVEVAEREAVKPAPQPAETEKTAAVAPSTAGSAPEGKPEPAAVAKAPPADAPVEVAEREVEEPAPQPASAEKAATVAPSAVAPEPRASETERRPAPRAEAARQEAPKPAPPPETTRRMAALTPAAPPATRSAALDPLAARLEEARRHLAAGRLVEPAGDNAQESYRAALALQPWNNEARRGLDELAARYVRLAETAEARGDWIGAVEHLETAQAIAPDHPDVVQLQETRRLAAAAVGPQEPAKTSAVEPAVAAAPTAVAAVAPPAVTAVAPPRRVALARPRPERPLAPPPQQRPASRPAPSAPLDLAALDSAERLKAALARGADPNTAYEGLRRPLTIAAQRRRPDVVSVLLRNGADPNAQTRDAATPLMYAAWNGDLVTATFLLEAGADTDIENLDGKTPLMAAAARGHAALAELLLRNGAEVDAQNVLGWTALMYAAWGGHHDVVKLLLEQGADSAIRNRDGHTAAVLAEMREQPALARLMTVPTRTN